MAFPILLLAGTSTGVSSPFFTSLCRGNISYCLVMAVVTSLILPISLPLMVKVLAHATLDYDFTDMALFLAMIIFVPLGAAFVFRMLAPGLLEPMNRISYPISLLVVAGINFGALGRYVPYLKTNPQQILYCVVYSIGLALVLALLGWSSTRTRTWADRVAASGSQVWVNNILIIALAVYLNQPLAATLGAFYMIPFYGFIVFYSVLAMIEIINHIGNITFPGNFKPHQSILSKRNDLTGKRDFSIFSAKYVLENKMIVFEGYDHDGQLRLRFPWKAQRVNAIA